MVASYTSNLRLTKQGDDDNPNTWGQVVNAQVIELIEDAISGIAEIDITGTSNINIASTVVNGGTDDARMSVLHLTGTLGANIELTVPSVDKQYVIHCDWSGAYTVTVKPAGGSSGLVFNTGSILPVYINGTTIEQVGISDALLIPNNLSDLSNVATARTNLGLTDAATTTVASILAQASIATTADIIAADIFATAAQGDKADTALQPNGDGSGLTGIALKGETISTPQTYTANSLITVPHNFAGIPKLMDYSYVCINSELGYTAGQEVKGFSSYVSTPSYNYTGCSMWADGTNMYLKVSNNGISLLNVATGLFGAILTPANWKIVLKGWY